MPRPRRRGFTLVEMLVVITIIGMLMSMLLPAVQASVEQARRIKCLTNTRELSKAVLAYENYYERFPGYTNDVSGNQVSWVVMILPQLDREPEWEDWSDGSTPNNQDIKYMSNMICESDPPDSTEGAHNSYVINAGYYQDNDKRTANGIAHDQTGAGVRMSVDQIQDGLDRTLLIAENIQAANWSEIGKGPNSFVWHQTANENRKVNGNKTDAPPAATNELDSARPSSFHPGGVNVAFCGQNAQFMREDVDYEVYIQLMTTDNEESSAPAAVKNRIVGDNEY